MNDLEQLKSLLFGAEKQVLDSISERVQLPEARAADIAAVLAEAVRISNVRDGELATSLKEPVSRILRESFHESPEEFGDALYPVMGPAIRKSIAHTLKAFAQQINQTLEYSLTLKGLKWRLQAARAGVPFGAYIMQQSLLYRVEQAYLISRGNGLLMGHVHHDASHIKDSDAVSAMFTAIQDFVKESFSPDRSGRLETADMGEFTLWAVHGPHALLVCVIRGVPPATLRDELSGVLERLHFRYGDAMRHYGGDTATIAGVEDELARCLAFEAARPVEQKRRGPGWATIIVLALVAAGIGWWGYHRWLDAEAAGRLRIVTAETPGLYIGRIEQRDGMFVLHGLRDPLAASLDDIAAQAGIDRARLDAELRPFRSLDDALRLERARAVLAPPDSVRLVPDGERLTVSGVAPAAWLADARRRGAALDGEWAVSFDAVEIAGWDRLLSDAAGIDGSRLYFDEDTSLTAASEDELGELALRISAVASGARDIGAGMVVAVTGHTDGAGTPAYNEQLAAERAAVVVTALTDAGIPAGMIRISSEVPESLAGEVEPERRRVSIGVTLTAPPVLSE